MVMASRVAMLFSRSCPRVDCRTLIRGVASMDSLEMGFAIASEVVAYIVLMIS